MNKMNSAIRARALLAFTRPTPSLLPASCVWTQSLQRAHYSGKTLHIEEVDPDIVWKRILKWKTLQIEKVESGIVLKRRKGIQQFRRTELPGIWLRDNCRCSKCINQDTMQRTLNTFDIPPDIKPETVEDRKDGVHVTWPDGHESLYSWDFLKQYLFNSVRPVELVKVHHFGAEAAQNPPSVKYDKVMAYDSGVAELTAKIREHGFAFVEDTPYEDANDTKRLLERIGPIRETHYGGFYDFTPDLAKADTAYTNLALSAHTDTTYFTDPAGLQAFHLLSHKPAPGAPADDPDSDPDVASGGKSLLVDGFHAAKILEAENPRAYKILSNHGLPWHASGNQGITITGRKLYPVFEHHHNDLQRIRWNNDDRGVVPLGSRGWYAAARLWNEILTRKEVECWIQLEPGKTLIFDNWRVLHGRSAFTGIRRICGAYINRDDFISRWRNTNFPREEVLKHVIG